MSQNPPNFSRRSRPETDFGEDDGPNSARPRQRKGISNERKSSARRNETFSSQIQDETINNNEDDHLEIDEIHLSDEDDVKSPHRNGIFNTFN